MFALVEETYAGFLQPLIWNIILSNLSLGKLISCNQIGIWGLFWFDDDGEMMEKCLKTGLIGAKANYYEAAE